MTASIDTFGIVVAQLDPGTTNVQANLALIRATREEAARHEADLVVFPHLFLSGLPLPDPTDLPALLCACRQALDELAQESAQPGYPALLLGAPWAHEGRLFDAVHLIAQGSVVATRCRVTVGLEGPAAYPFTAGPMPGPFSVNGVRIGLLIGSDFETPDVAECLMETGAEILIAPDAAAYHRAGFDIRLQQMVARVVECALPVIHVNGVGGAGQWVLDGASVALNPDRTLAMQFPNFQPRVRMTRWQRFESGWRCLEAPMAQRSTGAWADYEACLLALRDAMRKAERKGLLLDLSKVRDGGLGALLAVDAAGPNAVRALTATSCPKDRAEATIIASTLGVRLDHLSLDAAATAFNAELDRMDRGTEAPVDLTMPALIAIADRLDLLPVRPAPAYAEKGASAFIPVFNPVKPLDAATIADLLIQRASARPAGAKGPERVSLTGWPQPDLLASSSEHVSTRLSRPIRLPALSGPLFAPRPDLDMNAATSV